MQDFISTRMVNGWLRTCTTNVYNKRGGNKGDINDDSCDSNTVNQCRTIMTGVELTKVPPSLSLGPLLLPTFIAAVDSRSLGYRYISRQFHTSMSKQMTYVDDDREARYRQPGGYQTSSEFRD